MTAPDPGPLPSIFVVSLPRSVERRERLIARAGELGIPLTFVDAVDGRALPAELAQRYDAAAARRQYGRGLTPGELGCHFSHEKVWQLLRERGLEWAVVLEDDPVLDETFLPAVRAVARLTRPWDLIRLAGYRQRPGRVVERLADGRELLLPSRRMNGSNAYALHRHGAEKLLRFTRQVRHPVDNAIDRHWENGLLLYAVRPFPIREDITQASTIRAVRQRTPEDPAPLADQLALRVRRLSDSLHRRWFNLTHHRLL